MLPDLNRERERERINEAVTGLLAARDTLDADITGFACHLRRSFDAVTAGLIPHWNPVPVAAATGTERCCHHLQGILFARAALRMMRWHDDQPR
ncbi:hypothetical protein OHA98_22145 [Streptomyces sp. NBC_00654]|uniref:hypothetical protein n=1 Tax=Streptomyces sp. NBC_00654 TaxID=2975799 RepID=UPI00225413BB|nr:hypothetical protein [Streptomyces sp. NBC_00654]MCX4967414.1 hypothetical protein [Streptomyces sp. NBC_00654]